MSKQRAYLLKHRFQLSVQEYDTLLAQQDRSCAICRGDNGSRQLAVDHDHRTGEVRGLLCTRCNLLLGYAKDQPELLQAAILYLLVDKSLLEQFQQTDAFFTIVDKGA